MMTLRRSYIFFDVVGRQRLQSSSTSHRRVTQPKGQDRLPIDVLAGVLLTSTAKLHSLNVGGEDILRP